MIPTAQTVLPYISDISTDEELVAIGLKKQDTLSDLVYDPKISNVSDREDDDKLTKVGYSHCDTDESDDDPLDTSRVRMDICQWCKCGNCSLMASEIENYCCNDSGAVLEILDSEQANCIVECQKFKDFAENRNVLELLAYMAHMLVLIKNWHETRTIMSRMKGCDMPVIGAICI